MDKIEFVGRVNLVSLYRTTDEVAVWFGDIYGCVPRRCEMFGDSVRVTIEPERCDSRPHWSDAPDWAEWLAQDRDGRWYWYCRRPLATRRVMWSVAPDDIVIEAGRGPENPNWKGALERRPKRVNVRGIDELRDEIEELNRRACEEIDARDREIERLQGELMGCLAEIDRLTDQLKEGLYAEM